MVQRDESKVPRQPKVIETPLVGDQPEPKCLEVEPRMESDHCQWVREFLDRRLGGPVDHLRGTVGSGAVRCCRSCSGERASQGRPVRVRFLGVWRWCGAE